VIAVGLVAAVLIGVPAVFALLGVLLGLVAAVVAIAIALAPWLALGFGLYKLHQRSPAGRQAQAGMAGGGWAHVGPPPQQPGPVRYADSAWRAVPPAPPAPPDPMARLPQEQREQVERIRSKAAALIERAGRFPTGSRKLHLVRRTLDTYLPSTLDAYLALAPGADDWVVAPDGRTGVQVLRDQLAILEAEVDEVANDLWQADVQRLLANERFLEGHFGRRQSDELTIR
jgi:membrane protein implicated in regulation of membrane protease activity